MLFKIFSCSSLRLCSSVLFLRKPTYLITFPSVPLSYGVQFSLQYCHSDVSDNLIRKSISYRQSQPLSISNRIISAFLPILRMNLFLIVFDSECLGRIITIKRFILRIKATGYKHQIPTTSPQQPAWPMPFFWLALPQYLLSMHSFSHILCYEKKLINLLIFIQNDRYSNFKITDS